MRKLSDSDKEFLTSDRLQNIKEKVMSMVIRQAAVNSSAGSKAGGGVMAYMKAHGEEAARYIISVLIGITLVGGSAFASNSAKPGDFLYTVKRVKEEARLLVTFSPQARANLQAQFAIERMQDLQDMQPQAQAQAGAEVSNAIKSLTKVENELKAKGNLSAAAEVQTEIDKLEAQAKAQGVSY